MANRIYGEARLNLEDGRELTLRMDFGALCEAEDAADAGTEEIMAAFASGHPRLKLARAMLYGALRYHHSELTLADAGDMLLSDSEATSEAMGKAVSEMADRKAAKNPQTGAAQAAVKSPRGIGTRSSKHGSKAA